MERDPSTLPEIEATTDTQTSSADRQPLKPTVTVVIATMIVCLSAFVWMCFFCWWTIESLQQSLMLFLLGSGIVAAILTLAIIQIRGVYGGSLRCAALSAGVMTGLSLMYGIFSMELIANFPRDMFLSLILSGYVTFVVGLMFSSIATSVWAARLLAHARGISPAAKMQFSFRALMVAVTVISVMIAVLMNLTELLIHLPAMFLVGIVVLSALAVPDHRCWLPNAMRRGRSVPQETHPFAIWLCAVIGTVMAIQNQVLSNLGFVFYAGGLAPFVLTLCVIVHRVVVGVAIAGTLSLLLGFQLGRWCTVVWVFLGGQLLLTMALGENYFYLHEETWVAVIGWASTFLASGLAWLKTHRSRAIFRRRSRMLAGWGCLFGLPFALLTTFRLNADWSGRWHSDYPMLMMTIIQTSVVIGLMAAEYGREATAEPDLVE